MRPLLRATLHLRETRRPMVARLLPHMSRHRHQLADHHHPTTHTTRTPTITIRLAEQPQETTPGSHRSQSNGPPPARRHDTKGQHPKPLKPVTGRQTRKGPKREPRTPHNHPARSSHPHTPRIRSLVRPPRRRPQHPPHRSSPPHHTTSRPQHTQTRRQTTHLTGCQYNMNG